MLRSAVSVGCVAALIAAAVLATRLRHTRRTPSPLRGGEPFAERLGVTVGRSGGMVFGASLSGVLTIGAGGRLMMRVMAATSPEEVQGRLTEADEVVGEVTIGGSVFLILAVGIGAGVVGLAIFATFRRWFPDRSLAAGLLGVAIGSGAFARPSGFLDSSNIDFALLSPVALAVALCLATLVLFGATFGVLVDHLAPRWPRPGWSLQGVISLVPFAILLPAPTLLIAVSAAVLVASTKPGLRSRAAADPLARRHPGRGTRVGRAVIVVLGGLGGASIVLAAAQVLAA